MRVTAVIVAAGRGTRMGGAANKVLLPLAGLPILAHVLAAFADAPRISEIVLVAREGEEEDVTSLLPARARTRTRIVRGGAERRDSSLFGVRAASGDLVLIHDAARPLVSRELIDRVIDGTIAHGACVPVVPVVDTVRRVGPAGLLPDVIERFGLVAIQTPQGFRTEVILRGLAETTGLTLPDDAAAVLACGLPVSVVDGERENLKVTTASDLALAEAFLAQRRRRVVRPADPG